MKPEIRNVYVTLKTTILHKQRLLTFTHTRPLNRNSFHSEDQRIIDHLGYCLEYQNVDYKISEEYADADINLIAIEKKNCTKLHIAITMLL